MKPARYIPSVFILCAGIFAGCDHSGTTASDGDRGLATAAAVGPASGSWQKINSQFISAHIPAMTPYSALLGWALDPYQPLNGGFRVRRYANGSNLLMNVSLRDLDIAGTTQLWAIDNVLRLRKNIDPYSAGGGSWTTVCEACSYDRVATGAGGQVYLVTRGPNNAVTKYVPGMPSYNWPLLDYFITEVDVDNNGDVWAVYEDGSKIIKYPGGNRANKVEYPAPAGMKLKDIAVGNGKVFVTNQNEPFETVMFLTYKFTPPSTFQATNLFAQELQVDASGRGWATNPYGLWKYVP